MKIKILPPPSQSLQEALESEGFRFPCGGKGICGRCRIKAPMLEPTPKDYKFFTEKEIADGLRLACDKTIDLAIEIECYMAKSSPARKLEDPAITVILGDTSTEISIVEHGIIETLVLASPKADTIPLRSVIGKNAIELYEKYSVAKAAIMLVAGTTDRMRAFCRNGIDTDLLTMGDTLDAAIFDMPAEEVYLPPFPSVFCGSLELLELDAAQDGTLLIIAGQSIRFLHKGSESIVCTAITKDNFQIPNKAVWATIKYFLQQHDTQAVVFAGNPPQELARYLTDVGCQYSMVQSRAGAAAALAAEDNRHKTRLNKLSRKTAAITVTEDEIWQELLCRL